MHVQDPSLASSFKKHWGYPDRSVPCTNDAGSCEYLDSVYWMHDVSMLYTFILWAVLGGIFLIWGTSRAIARLCPPRNIRTKELESQKLARTSTLRRLYRTATSSLRHQLLPEVFQQTTRLQVLILAILLAYLLVFSLVGIVYKTWITPVKNHPGVFNTRVGFGGFADRVGALAYALTPLTIFLSSRESLLTLITGISYQHFNFLHRWTGRIIFVQSFLHTLGWTIIEGKLYQPQPMVYKEFISETYIIWGIVAMTLITFLHIFSIRSVIGWTGYEFFRVTHVIVAGVYIGACWAHWSKLACWMIASISIMLLDQSIRCLRLALIHFRKLPSDRLGFLPAKATLTTFPTSTGPTIRLTFSHPNVTWKAGQHFFLTFPALSLWQAHPFTVLSSADPRSKHQQHAYIIRPLSGETSKLAQLAGRTSETEAILVGPYGTAVLGNDRDNVLAIAGGTGITFALPVAKEAAKRGSVVELVWVVREARDMRWIEKEVEELRSEYHIGIRVFVTQEGGDGSSSLVPNSEKETGEQTTEVDGAPSDNGKALSSKVFELGAAKAEESRAGLEIIYLGSSRPAMSDILAEFLDKAGRYKHGQRLQVIGSGPPKMGRDLRVAVATSNDTGKVWRGEESGDVALYWDNR